MNQDTAGFAGLVDLASEAMGGRALLASDEFFAEKENLLKPGRGVFIPGRYTERGKWMDGWESRRRRTPGHDWCVVALGAMGSVEAVDIDTNHFTGNYPPFASLDACDAPRATAEQLRDEVRWTRIVPQRPLRGGSQNLFTTLEGGPWSHVRLNIYPAGGVARLRVYGRPTCAPDGHGGRVDLAALANGGEALACSDMYFSSMHNMLLPGRAEDMGQGWETRRSRPPGEDWAILKLGWPGLVEELEVDTNYFKGNFPDRCAVEGLYWPGAPPSALVRSQAWAPVLTSTKLRAHEQRLLPTENAGPWTHLRLRITPDGGVSRFRAWGKVQVQPPEPDSPLLAAVNGLQGAARAEALARCCGARRWVEQLAEAGPFVSVTQLLGVAEDLWWHLDEADWREAFTHHPRIGADVASLRERFSQTAGWSEGEQAGVQGASEEVLAALAAGNAAYEERFGYIFIVCASGLSAEEMLGRLKERLDNPPEGELRIAAGEQAKITALRLRKLGSET